MQVRFEFYSKILRKQISLFVLTVKHGMKKEGDRVTQPGTLDKVLFIMDLLCFNLLLTIYRLMHLYVLRSQNTTLSGLMGIVIISIMHFVKLRRIGKFPKYQTCQLELIYKFRVSRHL
jgi:hypothetical protein